MDARLLPYLDQSPLQDLIDFREPVPGGRPLGFHNPAAYVSVPTYLCPSDPAPDGAEVKFGRFSFGTDLKGTNYPVNSGSGAYEEGVKAYYDPAFPTDGPFYFDSSMPFAGLRDGVTNTLLASECVRGLGVDLTDTPRESLSRPYAVAASLSAGRGRVGEVPGGVDPMFTEAEARAAADWRGDRGYPWIWGRASATLFNAALGPDSDTPDAFAHSRGWFAARSYHPGGVNAALADGSVAFASDSIDADTWRAFSTRAGGEVTEGLWATAGGLPSPGVACAVRP